MELSRVRFLSLPAAFAGIACLAFCRSSSGDVPETLQFNTHVRPILSDKCFACHGFDVKNRQADLRLDTFEGATSDQNGHASIVPHHPEKSELWQRITSTEPAEVMPPPDSHKSLSDDEKEILRRWIEQGAKYQKHWAFETPTPITPPATDATSNNAIDQFIAQRLQESGFKLSPEADRETLLRRVAFALTGLPPTLEERAAYLNDTQSDAYEQMVDRYLNSQRFGEEMARHWLDVARYGDTHGMHLDNERQTWAYRDWVINAFNRNLPFDQFTIDQLAGDLLPEPSRDQLIATGFNRCNVTTSEGGSINDELLYRYAVDRTSTTFQAWLGLTGGCAVCHDHKFDPISANEFYSFYAFFNSAADPGFDGNALLTQPVLKMDSEEDKKQLAQLDTQIAEKQTAIDTLAKQLNYIDPADGATGSSASAVEIVWMDDEFPSNGKLQASPGAATMFVTQDASNPAVSTPVLSGTKSLKRTDAGLAQDVWDQATTGLILPADGKLFAHVWLEPTNLPKSVMVQYFKNGWMHRAVWGDYEAIAWGTANTTERVHMGDLPAGGQWVRLEVPLEKIGLATGDSVTGFALTQFGGTVYWDKVGVAGTSDPARDPSLSFLAWWKQATGKDTPGLPGDLIQIAKDGPEKEVAADIKERLRLHYLQNVCNSTKPTFAPLMAERAALQGQRKQLDDAIPSTFVFRDMASPRESFVMLRGNYDKPGDKVEPAVPAVFPALKKANPEGRATRLDLAKWLVAPENPLTSRVTVNRLWQQFFGVGIVKTSYDFGSQGEMPSHPALLDWLAQHFQQSNWNVKELVRLVVCSKTFKQSPRLSEELWRVDPENRMLARGPRFRLDAEQLRDNALFVSGLMQLEMGGKGVRPYQPDNIWEPVGFAGSNTQNYKRDTGSALYRRSIYTFYKRTAPPPFMINFDAPNREQTCSMREKSNTPLQALQLMNDVQHVEAARALAERMLLQGGITLSQKIDFAYQVVLARSPKLSELHIVERQWSLHHARYQQDLEAAKKLIASGESKPNEKFDPSELATATMVANMILNLDETVTRN